MIKIDNLPRFLRWGVFVSILGATAAWLFLTLPNRPLMWSAFTQGTYYIVFLLVIAWSYVVISRLSEAGAERIFLFIRENRAGFLLALVLCAIPLFSIEPALRVLADEANVISVSKSMLYDKKVDNVVEGTVQFLTYNPIIRTHEKRPFLYPFLVHIAHTLTGYRIANGFAVNLIALFAIFTLLYAFLRPYVGSAWAAACVIGAAAQPILLLSARSAGIDTVFVCFMIASAYSLHRFLARPAAGSFALFWVNILMLAHTRYEAGLFFALAVLLLLIFRAIRLEYFLQFAWVYAATPLFFLPLLWQRVLIPAISPADTQEKYFSAQHFIHHSWVFLKNAFSFGFYLPYANLLNIIGIAGLVYFVVRLIGRLDARPRSDYQWAAMCGVIVIASWSVFCACYFGKMDHPASARYFILPSVLLSCLAFLFLRRVAGGKIHGRWAVAAAVCFFVLYHPVAIQDRFFKIQILFREYQFVRNALAHEPDRNFLLIYERPGLFTIHNYGTISFVTANQQKIGFAKQYQNRLLRKVYVVQGIEYGTRKPKEANMLDPEVYKLTTLSEMQNTGEAFVRISEAVLELP